MADTGEGPGGPGPPLFWQKKNKKTNKIMKKTQKEEQPAGQAIFANQYCFNIAKKPGPPLAQSLDLPLVILRKNTVSSFYIGELTHAIKFRKHNLHMLALNAIFDCFA